MRTTIVYSPHPDDETLRLSGYLTVAKARGDRLILVAVTGGGASGARPETMTVGELIDLRESEQMGAWRALGGVEPVSLVVRLGLTDGAVTSAPVTAMAEALHSIWSPVSSVEHYVAAAKTDAHADHRAVAYGVSALGTGHVVRYARPPEEVATKSGTLYKPVDLDACKAADNAYEPFGWSSVPTLFDALRQNGYASRVFA